ncbi:SGNH/GDSL hydrolase family protein [Wenzhouxiangella sp. XN201]|uniref:SGNH/GDSL hydrolase family protein n=1 Tax=Wenzhouxiangella sp. XN201 TaxID=2710755 RepID=UPI0013C6D99B|nr:SGNH/GDSL hydrolase family protein [Wenzhouxiangella sp. XN201]NEZ04439.1 SGNH/GDSL hydrolase family protein [Wenzhouxiangella sp. XN201]
MASSSRNVALQALATLALAGAPLYWLQGRHVRRKTPHLDEAPGERSGSVAGPEAVMRIAGLGESPMAAVGLADQAESVVPRLAAEVASRRNRGVDWQTAARSGATIDFTRTRLLPLLDADPTDVVIVALGVNDCLRLSSVRRWRVELARLIDAIRSRLEPGRIVLAGVPPMQHFPALPIPLSAMLGLRATLLDAATRQFAESEDDVLHAPMNFVEHPDGLFCRDGFHPNARAHALWARQLADLLNTP